MKIRLQALLAFYLSGVLILGVIESILPWCLLLGGSSTAESVIELPLELVSEDVRDGDGKDSARRMHFLPGIGFPTNMQAKIDVVRDRDAYVLEWLVFCRNASTCIDQINNRTYVNSQVHFNDKYHVQEQYANWRSVPIKTRRTIERKVTDMCRGTRPSLERLDEYLCMRRYSPFRSVKVMHVDGDLYMCGSIVLSAGEKNPSVVDALRSNSNDELVRDILKGLD